MAGSLGLGEALRSARRRANLSQARVAERVGVAVATVSGWETENRKLPVTWLPILCRALEISPAELLETAYGKGEGDA